MSISQLVSRLQKLQKECEFFVEVVDMRIMVSKCDRELRFLKRRRKLAKKKADLIASLITAIYSK